MESTGITVDVVRYYLEWGYLYHREYEEYDCIGWLYCFKPGTPFDYWLHNGWASSFSKEPGHLDVYYTIHEAYELYAAELHSTKLWRVLE